jgi:hypothetical protein
MSADVVNEITTAICDVEEFEVRAVDNSSASSSNVASVAGRTQDLQSRYGPIISPAAESGDGAARSRRALARRVRVRA